MGMRHRPGETGVRIKVAGTTVAHVVGGRVMKVRWRMGYERWAVGAKFFGTCRISN